MTVTERLSAAPKGDALKTVTLPADNQTSTLRLALFRLQSRQPPRNEQDDEPNDEEDRVLILRRTAVLAACTLALAVFPAHFACAAAPADTAPAAQAPAVDSEASEAATGQDLSQSLSRSVSKTARHYHRRPSRHSSRSRPLSSRGILSAPEAAAAEASVVGRLALVTSDKAVIVAGRETGGRVLSICPKGQYLALSGQTPTQYAVLMIDHSIGLVAKSDVQLLEYQVVSNAPDASGDASGTAANGSVGQRLVQAAQGYLGVPYVWGGNTTAGIDCSGFVKAVYGVQGISLPRHSGDQAAIGYDVPRGDWSTWMPGDRMYFACHHPEIDHTGMYIGGGYFIHASAGHGHQVAIDRVDGAYYAQHLVCVRRSKELLGDAPAPGPAARTASAPAADDSEADQY